MTRSESAARKRSDLSLPRHPDEIPIIGNRNLAPVEFPPNMLWHGDVADLLAALPLTQTFDLIVTSPPYNIGKSYEQRLSLDEYVEWQAGVISELVGRLRDEGSICWQVGNFVQSGQITPLDIVLDPIFRRHNLQLRNRIVWHFGHGLHTKRRFSGRYEVVMWYTKSDRYVFNLNDVRVRSKYPGKKHFKGAKVGQLSGNPLGKNPEDVWFIPNVKSNHIEKTSHPCQFPVGLIERLVMALTNAGGLVFDPFAGVGSAGVAAIIHQRHFWGAEIAKEYVVEAKLRIDQAMRGDPKYRPHDKPLYDHTRSRLSETPPEWRGRADD